MNSDLLQGACRTDCSAAGCGRRQRHDRPPGRLYVAYTNGFHVRTFNTVTNYVGPFGLAYHYPSKSRFVLDSGDRVIRRMQ